MEMCTHSKMTGVRFILLVTMKNEQKRPLWIKGFIPQRNFNFWRTMSPKWTFYRQFLGVLLRLLNLEHVFIFANFGVWLYLESFFLWTAVSFVISLFFCPKLNTLFLLCLFLKEPAFLRLWLGHHILEINQKAQGLKT